MEIRKTKIEELDKVMAIYAHARQFMVETGNPNQWVNIKPRREWIVADIENGNSYVCVEKDEIAATFFYSNEPDSTYAQIYDGAWVNDRAYGVVHRIASAGTIKSNTALRSM